VELMWLLGKLTPDFKTIADLCKAYQTRLKRGNWAKPRKR
jgi:hypothetical protein